jgi:hypothetical protein
MPVIAALLALSLAAAPAAPPAAPAPAKVTIKVDVEPASAAIEIDGKPVAGNALEVEKDDATHKLTITAKGYQPYAEELTFGESQKLVVKLDKVGQKPTARTPKKPNEKPNEKTNRIDTKSPYGN